ncbi:hypothetical protein B0H66DRAFT_550492 [Apodospora peruviana]|uniref:U4/U6.U5 small nuclear ribonucleoprotein 27kDa protein domain-containing protein n=1 Tax=Apodospora peruviana TaxID=516989 RepID=A0AAE0MCR7_9PEZI|nr:hypothetical protein B0H66DRAFT_550492 [Apodospora peruviana]
MADHHARGGSRRGGDRPPYDGLRDRPGRDGRDNRDRNYDRDRRSHRYRDGDAERDRNRDHRRYRSRSRDRQNRRRSRSPLRDRNPDRRDDRPRNVPEVDRGLRSRRGGDRDSYRDQDCDHGGKPAKRSTRDNVTDRRRSESPRASTSPRRPTLDSIEKDPATLPTRAKTFEQPKPPVVAPTPPAPVSFKVKGHDRREGSHGAEQHSRGQSQEHEDGRYHSNPPAEEEHARSRFDTEPMDEDEVDDIVVEDDGLEAMQAMMGFGGFDSTKGKKIQGNNVGAVRKEKKTEYRQYMNRVGGFNRPLSPSR